MVITSLRAGCHDTQRSRWRPDGGPSGHRAVSCHTDLAQLSPGGEEKLPVVYIVRKPASSTGCIVLYVIACNERSTPKHPTFVSTFSAFHSVCCRKVAHSRTHYLLSLVVRGCPCCPCCRCSKRNDRSGVDQSSARLSREGCKIATTSVWCMGRVT